MSAKKLPKTDSIQKLAQFWDTHDLTDFEQQLEEVKSASLRAGNRGDRASLVSRGPGG